MLRTLKDLKKCTIGATDGDIGQVKDLYFDDHAWAIRYLVVNTGNWLLDREVLISPISINKPDWPTHRLAASISRDQVKNSPDIDTHKPVSRQQEEFYLGYYGYPAYWGDTGLWGGGMIPVALAPRYNGLDGLGTDRERALENMDRAERERHENDDPNLRSCDTVVGYHIQTSDGELGHVEDFLIDDETWAVRYMIVNTSNWWIGHKILVAPHWIKSVNWSDETVSVDLSREVMKAAPAYDMSAPFDRHAETDLYDHYGRAPYWHNREPTVNRKSAL